MRTQLGVFCVLAAVFAAACGDDETEKLGDVDGDGWPRPLDCNNSDGSIFPGADEIPYDGIDQDCSGSDLTDVDGDGYDGGERGSRGSAGAAGAESGANGSADDCDDTRPDVNPAGVEVCDDGIDQDCSGADQSCDALDRDADGVTAAEGDCNDLDPSIGPEQDEIYYNGVDDDCDPGTEDADRDGDGFSRTSGGDCDDEDPDVFPGADEIAYDDIDQDCSGGDLDDLDGDGALGGPEGTDCDDLDPTVRPGGDEVVLDGVDQNCDGSDVAGTDAFFPLGVAQAVPAGVPALTDGISEYGDPIGAVAWADSRVAPSQDVYMLALGFDGLPLGVELQVATGGLAKSNVQLASDGHDFLVTWETTDGIFGRLMHATGPTADETQIAPAGALGSNVSFGGGNYAVAWRQADAVPSELRIRMLSPEGVKGENLLIVEDDAARDVAIAGRDSELLAVYTSGGIYGFALNGLGEVQGGRFTVLRSEFVSSPAIAASDDGYYVAYQRGTVPAVVFGVTVSPEGNAARTHTRLSDDALTIGNLSAIATESGYAVAWSDSRHTVVPPGYGAIYGNQVSFDGVPVWSSDRPLHVAIGAQLGGMTWVAGRTLITSRSAEGIGSLNPMW